MKFDFSSGKYDSGHSMQFLNQKELGSNYYSDTKVVLLFE